MALYLFLVPASVLAILLLIEFRLGRLNGAWRDAALDVALTEIEEEPGFLGSKALTGRAGSRRVRLEVHRRNDRDSGTLITVSGDSGLTLRRETVGTAFEKALGNREIEVGDQGFDREVYVQGRPEVVRALLDAETRLLVRELLQGRIRMAGPVTGPMTTISAADVAILGGDLRAYLGRHLFGDDLRGRLAGVLRGLLAAADRLTQPPGLSIPDRIAQNNEREPEWRVRVQNLLVLAGSYPGHPATRETLRRGCQDESEEVQLRAALALGDDGRPALLEIASRENSDDVCAAKAVATLAETLPPERALAILGHALRARRVATARACLEALGRVGGQRVVDTLAEVLAVESGEVAAAAASALGASGAAAAEAPLVDALRNESMNVRVTAAEALGRAGSIHAVLALKEAAARDGGLRRAARQAIARIQSRQAGASPGQLSLADGEAGRLTLADEDPGGRVSLADPGKADAVKK